MGGNTIVLLEHINVTIPRRKSVVSFYTTALGFSQDPRRPATNADDSQKRSIWVNARATQIHLTLTEKYQVMPGIICLVYPKLDRFCELLSLHNISYSSLDEEASSKENGDDDLKSAIRFQCSIGNCFAAREGTCPTPQ